MTLRFPGSAIGSQPAVYRMQNWYIAARDPQRITFRPSLKTLLRRFGVTAMAAMSIVLIASIRDVTAELGALSGKSDTVIMALDISLWVLGGMLAAAGLVSPLSTLWETVTVSRGMRGTLKVRARRIFGSTREWPLETLRSIGVIVQEHIIRARGAPCDVGHVWRVGVVDENGHWCVDLHVDYTKHASLPGHFPERTRECIEALEQITGLRCSGAPVFIEEGSVPVVMDDSHGMVSIGRRGGNVTQHVSASTESHTYHSLDEMPPEVRARVEEMMAQQRASGAQTFVSERITISGENGTRTYHSVDEMPPDVRARYEEARRKFHQE